MRKKEVQCYTCKHCMDILGTEEEATVVLCKLREVGIEADGANMYDHRLQTYGVGYAQITAPFRPCPYYHYLKAISTPESKLIHSPVNWQEYKDVQVH